MKTKCLIARLSLSCLSLLVACTPREDREQVMEPFPATKLLTAEKVRIAETFSVSFLMLKDDVLFVISNREDTMLYAYSIPDFSCVLRKGHKGNGPDEFQFTPSFCRTSTDDIYLWGYTSKAIRRFQLTEQKQLLPEQEYKLKHYDNFNQMYISHDSILVYSAIPGEFSLKKVNLNTGDVTGCIELEKDDHLESYFYQNRGYVAANDDYMVYAYVFKKQIDLYRISDFSLYKRIVGDYGKPVIDMNNSSGTIYHYVNIISTQDRIYTMCSEDGEPRMEVFDYDGHSIAKYKFDILPHVFEIDEKRGMIYGYNYEEEDYFLKYKM